MVKQVQGRGTLHLCSNAWDVFQLGITLKGTLMTLEREKGKMLCIISAYAFKITSLFVTITNKIFFIRT